jgi:MYXO-CTERM domain-containing protein
MRLPVMVALAFLAVLEPALVEPAHAGPVEQMVQLALHPSNPDVMVVRYVWGGDGMLFTRDGGKSWQLVCDSLLFDPVRNKSGPIAIAGDGTTMMGVFNGLYHDDGHGCAWAGEPQYDGQWIGDLAPHPTDPSITFAATSTGSSKLNGVVRRDASGTWSDVGEKQELLITRLLVVSHGSGLRFYMGAVKGQITPADGGTPQPNYVTRVSDDEGQTWREYAFGVTDGTFRLQGVDPTNPDRVVASINRAEDSGQPTSAANDTVLVSDDQGSHFTEYLTLTEIGGVAFAPDGRLWIGDLGTISDSSAPKGLWFAPSLAQAPTKLAMGDYPVQCLGYQKATDTLYACQHFWFGSVAQTDGAFSSIIKFTEVQSLVACGGTDVAATCQMQLCGAWCGFSHFAETPLCRVYKTPSCGPAAADLGSGGSGGGGAGAPAAGASADAGKSDAGVSNGSGGQGAAGSGGSASMHASGGCGCATAGAGRHQPFAVAGSLLLAFLVWRRRR